MPRSASGNSAEAGGKRRVLNGHVPAGARRRRPVFFPLHELDLEVGVLEVELDGEVAEDVFAHQLRDEDAGLAVGHVTLEVRENKKFFLCFAEPDPLHEPEMQNGQPALGILDTVKNGIDFLDHFRIHGVLPPVEKVVIL